ncbi:hypothetical protein JYG23_01235 [Sedimentibacter sp. zth1]|uniref:hypothetical protein n=1 Tax=Sedimentibacter sp. zth1 TaxID=2816908 RepID=UPI001A92A9AB|nr:hypothetical protein [Sedimentibacter sp. zth1]QSX06118.1 hypothetical protein JYG23_01235 [Sedimentibacter sp. zth1]
MYRLWAKTIINNKMIDSIDIQNNENISLNEKRKKCFNQIYYKLDISAPIWLTKHAQEFDEFKRITFKKDDFVDEVFFDKLEIELVDDGTDKKHKKSN